MAPMFDFDDLSDPEDNSQNCWSVGPSPREPREQSLSATPTENASDHHDSDGQKSPTGVARLTRTRRSAFAAHCAIVIEPSEKQVVADSSSRQCGTSNADTTEDFQRDCLLCTDNDGTPRTFCQKCRRCDFFSSSRNSRINWIVEDEDESRICNDGEERMGSLSATSAMNGWGDFEQPVERCRSCGCPAHQHKVLLAWKDNVRRSLWRFRTSTDASKKRGIPHSAELPAVASSWSPDDVAMFVLTAGFIDPRAREKPAPDVGMFSDRSRVLVSVVTPTSQRRHAFHPLLYKCFCAQTYAPKELVVVDTGEQPSAFMQATALKDPRVVYKHFQVCDAREDDALKTINVDRRAPASMQVLRLRKDPRLVLRGGVRQAGWSLGLKRNVACHLASGGVLVHFDDDDLYAPGYLRCMVDHLLGIVRRAIDREESPSVVDCSRLLPAAATLSEWHMVDLCDQSFGFVDPKTDAMISEEMRRPMQYGYGFTYAYTRAAWLLQAFPDAEWSEDGNFMAKLMAGGCPVSLVAAPASTDGLAAHSYHPDTTSGGEFNGFVRLGRAVPVPDAFRFFLPVLQEVVLGLQLKRGEAHPLRREMHELFEEGEVPAEVTIAGKSSYKPSYVVRQVPSPGARMSDVSRSGLKSLCPSVAGPRPDCGPSSTRYVPR